MPVESADAFRQNLLQLTPDQRMRVERYAVRRNDTVASIAKQFATTPAMIRELNGLEANSRIEVDSELRIPSSVTSLPPKVIRAAALVDGKESLRKGRNRHLHVVARGDSLSAISRKTGVPVAKLASLNGMGPDDTLRAGQRLKLPSDAGYDEPPTKGRKTKGSAAASPKGRRVTYVVRAGDTLFSISRLLEVPVQSLRSWNSLGANASIRAGQKLIAFVRNGS